MHAAGWAALQLGLYITSKGDMVSLRVFARKQKGGTEIEQRKLELLKAIQPKEKGNKNTDQHSSKKQSLAAS